MILQALSEYYKRLAEENLVPEYGFKVQSIDFLIVLNKDGSFKNLRDIRQVSGKKRKGRDWWVPKGSEEVENRTCGIAANLLWDKLEYVFGRDPEEKKAQNPERRKKEHKAFIKKIEEPFGDCPDDAGIRAVLSFLRKGSFNAVFDSDAESDLKKSGGNISFALADDRGHPVFQRDAVLEIIREKAKNPQGEKRTCLVSGKQDVPARLHSPIKGVWGAQTSGASIVSFNLGAFCSFGKKQGDNAPVGEQAEFAYTTALNYLLASEDQRMQAGDATTVFWAKKSCDIEKKLSSWLDPPKESEENESCSEIKELFTAVSQGVLPEEEENIPFYVLGLAPNASRLVIRFWYEGSVKEIKERIVQHFRDLKIVRAPYDREFSGLFKLLIATVVEEKGKNIPPNLGGEVMRAVLTGHNYPRTFFAGAIRPCKKGKPVNFARASIIKAFLVRDARISKSNRKEVSVKLDETYENIGYVLGRLFAVFERIQKNAQGEGLNRTIRDTYFGAAASSPQVTFPGLYKLAMHHLRKIRNKGSKSTLIWLEKKLSKIMELIPKEGYPAILGLEDQGRFIIGYYHQKQDFFTKKENREEGEENE